jgi:hypothetical protein
MATIKKAYQEIIALLEANADAQVSDVLESVVELASAKTGAGGGKASTFIRNEAGEVTAIRCYYHELWMDPRVVEFGAKRTSASGFNSMCKDGVSKWTKQQRDQKAAEGKALEMVADGTLAPGDIAEFLAEARTAEIIPREDGYGFATAEECMADSEERGLDV